MPILIPSKKIYSIENEKIVDNQINKVEAKLTKYTEAFEPTASLVDQYYAIAQDEYDLGAQDNLHTQFESRGKFASAYPRTLTYDWYFNFAGVIPLYIDKNIQIPIPSTDTYIEIGDTELITNPLVRISKSNGTGMVKSKSEFDWSNNELTIGYTIEELIRFNIEEGVETQNVVPLISKADDYYIGSVFSNNGISVGVSNDQSFTIKVSDQNPDKYDINLHLLIGSICIKGKTVIPNHSAVGETFGIDNENVEVDFYVPQSISVELRTGKYTLYSEDLNVSVSSDNYGKGISFKTNNLMQATYISTFENKMNATLNSYANGKEIATILCSFGDYFDTTGRRVISTKTSDKMSFNLYDEVVPLYRTEFGTDAPISLNQDRMGKTFSVLGSEIFFDGAVWQKLYLQESGFTEYVIHNGKGLATYKFAYVDDGFKIVEQTQILSETTARLYLPSVANGLPVVSIAENAFAMLIDDELGKEDHLCPEFVSIPHSVLRLEGGAFRNAHMLKHLIIGDGIETLKTGLLENCFNLETVVIGRNVKAIEANTFANCSMKYLCLYDDFPDKNYIEDEDILNIIMGDTAYYYSETFIERGWRFVDGIPTPWVK